MNPEHVALAVIALASIALIGALVLVAARARRRRLSEIPELNQHPERLEEELDASDDA